MSDIDDQASSFDAAIAAAMGARVAEPTQEAPAPEAAPAQEAAPAAPPVAAEPAIPKYILDREAAIEAREAKLREHEDAYNAWKKAKDDFSRDRVGYIKALDPEQSRAKLAEELYFDELGDKAPPEYRMSREAAQLRTENARMRAEFEGWKKEQEEAKAAAAQQAIVQEYHGKLAAYKPDASKYPMLAGLAQRKPELSANVMLQLGIQKAKETNGQVVLEGDAAAEAAEKFLKEQHEMYYGAVPAAQPTAAPVSSLWNSNTKTQTDAKIPDSKDADDKQLRKQALAAVGLEHLFWE